jgi:DNA polymerase-3 subunit alpha
MKPDIEIKEEYKETFLFEKEKEIFGFYLSSHPTTMFRKDNPYCIPLNSVENYFGKQIDTLILVEKVKVINTKKGDKMAFIVGSDETGSREFTIFPSQFKNFLDIEAGALLKIRGNVEKRLNEYQIIVEKIKYLEGEENE